MKFSGQVVPLLIDYRLARYGLASASLSHFLILGYPGRVICTGMDSETWHVREMMNNSYPFL